MPQMLLAALALAAAVDAPVTDVTVFSDRARVTRTTRVPISGTQVVELPPLLDRVDISTLRVEVTGAELVRVDLAPITPDDFPVTEGRRLLEELERVDDKLALAKSQQASYRNQAEALLALQPALPDDEGMRPPPKLDSGAWPAAVGWISEETSNLQQKARELQLRIDALERERRQLADKAELLGGAERRGGWKVTATLKGSGPATLAVTYLAGPARWYPTYDLQLQPEKNQVQVAFSGLVSQETGEDWTRARLVLSTAIPSAITRMPEPATWKLGELERFIPVPRPAHRPVRPAPPAPPLPVLKLDEAELVRDRLLARASQEPGEEVAESLGALNRDVAEFEGGTVGRGMGAAAPPVRGRAQLKKSAPMPSAPPPPPARAPQAAREEESYDFADDAVPGRSVAMESVQITSSDSSRSRASAPTVSYSLSPPPSWRPPQLARDLPAMAAGGYDLAWTSVQPETVATGKGAVRVALFSQQWPVKVERKLFPALAPEAYLVAELKNPTASPLPGGTAQLYVGADPAGQARLALVAPNEPFTLPLGLDRAIKMARNVELVTTEKGLIGKEDVTRYVTTIELANPYPIPVAVKVFDQWPLTPDEDVVVELLETKPWALQDKALGKLEWHLTLPANGRQTVQFTYSIRRPKDWKLYQRN